jgi:hypothetical protein
MDLPFEAHADENRVQETLMVAGNQNSPFGRDVLPAIYSEGKENYKAKLAPKLQKGIPQI